MGFLVWVLVSVVLITLRLLFEGLDLFVLIGTNWRAIVLTIVVLIIVLTVTTFREPMVTYDTAALAVGARR